MASVKNWFDLYVFSWLAPPKAINALDIIQVAIIAIIIYYIILLIRRTRAFRMLRGIMIIIIFIILAYILRMNTITWIIGNFSGIIVTAIIIIFQPELRKAIERVGQSNVLTNVFALGKNNIKKRFSDKTVNEIVNAVFDMAREKTGALIVIEKDILLNEYTNTGIELDSLISAQLLENIFEHNTPLHDGAVIIRNDRILAATCYLPLSDNMSLNKTFGTRHRAAVGISEVADCLTIVVSEETGNVSYTYEGNIFTGIHPNDLKEQLFKIQEYTQAKHEGSDTKGQEQA